MRSKFGLLFLLTCGVSGSASLYGQTTEITQLMQQVVEDEIPEDFAYFILVPESLKARAYTDSLQPYELREFKKDDPDFPEDFLYTQQEEVLNWRAYTLNKANLVPETHPHRIQPPLVKTVRFVDFRISEDALDSLWKNKEPHVIYVKKKKMWSKKKMWEHKKFKSELQRAWDYDKAHFPEEKLYVQFSKPLFSENGNYAKVRLFFSKMCKGYGFTSLYKKEKEAWVKVLEYQPTASVTTTTHVRCGDLMVFVED